MTTGHTVGTPDRRKADIIGFRQINDSPDLHMLSAYLCCAHEAYHSCAKS